MKCSKCDTENTLDARYCSTCGESLGTDSSHSKEITVVVEKQEFDDYILGKRFRIIKKLGKGGMGEVLLAEDVKLRRNVAIKSILLKENMADTSSKLRFLREAQTASQLDHPNICTIYEIYEEGDKDYIVMQYIDGVTVDQIIGSKKLGIEKILDIAIQVCGGMTEAHSKDVIHRDIKPSNIMVDKKGVIKILDFGLAKFTSGDSSPNNQLETNLTEKGFVLGTIAYISPEQARGKTLDRRTDVFSFGVVMYEMIEGINPFKLDEQIETLYNVLNKNVEFTREIPEELERIVRKALEKDREKRYQDFSEIGKDLEAFKITYAQLKNEAKGEVGGATEIIQVDERSKLMEELQKSSDKEDLGDMVYRIKKFNASTERVVATQTKRFDKKKLIWAIPVLAVILIAVFFIFIKPKPAPIVVPENKKFYLYLHDFENNTGEKDVPDMLSYLLMESLNQFSEFETIDKDTADSIAGEGDETQKITRLKAKFKIAYELSGKVSKDRDFYDIDAYLKPVDNENAQSYHFTTTGQLKDSFLISQVNELNRRVYSKLFPDKTDNPGIKWVSNIFGTQWQTFANYYTGYMYNKAADPGKSEPFLKKAKGILAAKYYLAEVSFFNGNREEARSLIEEIFPNLDKLTSALQLRVKAVDARLKFKFTDVISNLKQLKDELPFSKEALYTLGEAYFHIASPREAMIYYQQALDLDSKYSQALNHMGYCNSYLGAHDKAIELFEIVRSLTQSTNSFDSLGDGYFYAGDLVNSEIMKKRAIIPEDQGELISYPYQTLADIYTLKAEYGKAEEALNSYQQLEKSKSSAAYVLERQAFIDYVEQRYQPALEKIEKSIQTFDSEDINDSGYEVHWIKGLILVSLNKIPESKIELKWLEKFKSTFQLSWDNFHAGLKDYYLLEALIAEKENQADKADKNFKTIIEMKRKLSYWITYFNYQYFHTEYVKYLIRSQRYENALVEVDACLQFNSNYIPALWAKAEIFEKLNRSSEAKSVYERLTELYGESTENNYYRNLLKTRY